MQPRFKIVPPAWMQAAPTRAVLAALAQGRADGVGGRFVGGCVRDAVLGLPSQDIDIATPWPPDRVIERLEAARIKAIPTGIDHGTITAIKDDWRFEITTLRHDVETDGRHALVAYTDDWQADAARRDFTLNALYADADGVIYDPVDGLDDLMAGRVRFVGDPATRIREDALRMLRFFRFHARFAKGPPNAQALAACRDQRERMAILSGERIAQEMRRLIVGPRAVEALGLMGQVGLLQEIDPGLAMTEACAQMIALQAEWGALDWLRPFAMMLDDGFAAGRVASRLRLSNHERRRLLTMVNPDRALQPSEWADDKGWARALYRRGVEAAADLLLSLAARHGVAGQVLRQRLDESRAWTRPSLPVDGRDLMAIGLQGPAVGQFLSQLEDWWVERDFHPDRAACLAELSRRTAQEKPRP